MVDWHAPRTLFLQAESLQKMTCVFAGIYFYDFLLNLPYDWEVINKKYTRPVTMLGNCLYITSRYLAFICCVCMCVLISSYRAVSCPSLLRLVTLSGVVGIASASSLLFVRACVIWKWNRWVTACLSALLVAQYIVGIRSVILISSVYDPSIRQCTLDDVIEDRPVSVAVFITDFTLLAFILIGLQRSWRDARGFPLWYTLWNQGLLYFLLAITMEVPLVVFLMLNLNEVMNTLFIIPSVAMLVVGATRFHRELTKHSSGVTVYNVPALPSAEPDSFELVHARVVPLHGR
ncbi:unnamed protein product [Peniophora sp. CBMAI 1063]|nr:unnamed protein product [Peniophora sp. CBMAI 1063]